MGQFGHNLAALCHGGTIYKRARARDMMRLLRAIIGLVSPKTSYSAEQNKSFA